MQHQASALFNKIHGSAVIPVLLIFTNYLAKFLCAGGNPSLCFFLGWVGGLPSLWKKHCFNFDLTVKTEALAISSVLLDPFTPSVTVNISAGVAKLSCSPVKLVKLR